MLQTRILIIKNYWDKEQILLSAFSKLLSFILNGPNHAAILKDGMVHEMIGKGKVVTPYEEWLLKTNRLVYEYKPLVAVKLPKKDLPYGYWDLIPVGLNLLWYKITGKRLWNGEDMVIKEGYFCSEYIAVALGLDKAYLHTPVSLMKIDELKLVSTFKTQRGVGIIT